MKALQRFILVGTAGLLTALQAPAADISLAEYAFNIDGSLANVTLGDAVPGVVNTVGFDPVTGIGSISVSIVGPGPHYVGLFVDHEIDQFDNTFFNEYGSTSGAAVGGQSWEIDEPGYSFGNIYTNFGLTALDNGNGVPIGAPDDVSMAMAWNFDLKAGETASVSFLVSQTAPGSGFYLMQTDPDSLADIYMSSELTIQAVPEPATLALMGLGLGALGVWQTRRRSAAQSSSR